MQYLPARTSYRNISSVSAGYKNPATGCTRRAQTGNANAAATKIERFLAARTLALSRLFHRRVPCWSTSQTPLRTCIRASNPASLDRAVAGRPAMQAGLALHLAKHNPVVPPCCAGKRSRGLPTSRRPGQEVRARVRQQIPPALAHFEAQASSSCTSAKRRRGGGGRSARLVAVVDLATELRVRGGIVRSRRHSSHRRRRVSPAQATRWSSRGEGGRREEDSALAAKCRAAESTGEEACLMLEARLSWRRPTTGLAAAA